MTLYEYPILIAFRNPWTPGRNTRIRDGSPVRVIFAVDNGVSTFYGVVEKDQDKNFVLCPTEEAKSSLDDEADTSEQTFS